ncbi:MAG TPA: hypothetical protein VHY91_18430 [Pirellulales bacterium]|jgi:hypothetical protein|nr:hypothetical protein [Pirellulales bacterium]
MRFTPAVFAACVLGWLNGAGLAIGATTVDVANVAADAEVRIVVDQNDLVTVDWPTEGDSRGTATFRLSTDKPLIESLSLRATAEASHRLIARDLTPFTSVTVGTRNLETPAGWTIFFDQVDRRPYQRYAAELKLSAARATAAGSRGSVAFSQLTAGPFSGDLVFTFYAGSPLILVEAVVSTPENRHAIIYDAGLVAAPETIQRYAWSDFDDTEKSRNASPAKPAGPQAVRYRTIAAEMEGGAVAVFPPPHRFFYPLDFADNFGFNWSGRDYLAAPNGDGWGVRQPPEGDRRFTPWVNAPPDTQQRLGVFYLLSADGGSAALAAVRRYTHADRYVSLAGHKTFTSHYHIEHALDLLRQQAKAKANSTEIPAALQTPGFVRAFRTAGIDIVHLAEFHNSATPKLATDERLRQLRALHAECQRLSNDSFLLLPGEEPNVHLGGHWISLFPRPVLWVLNRPDGTPLVQTNAAGERVYHVGSAEDVLTLMEREHGLMWTAHARIKASVGFPDQYRDQAFFKSPHFLGAAWKAMPADYSRDTLGWRVLDLFDDMNNWCGPKQVLGEVDVFKVELGYELYGHANINYIELDHLPRFADGWAPLLESLRAGRFFTTTGEILITDFAIVPSAVHRSTVKARLKWTFPLGHAELVGGDGEKTYRQRIDLTDTKQLGELDFTRELTPELAACRWVRLEVWDIATNGAFTQPVWRPLE